MYACICALCIYVSFEVDVYVVGNILSVCMMVGMIYVHNDIVHGDTENIGGRISGVMLNGKCVEHEPTVDSKLSTSRSPAIKRDQKQD